jgi:hypothetical protein
MKYEIVKRDIFLRRGLTLKEKLSRLEEFPEDLQKLVREVPFTYDKVDKYIIEFLLGVEFRTPDAVKRELTIGRMMYAPKINLLVEDMSVVMYVPSPKSHSDLRATVAYIRGVSE